MDRLYPYQAVGARWLATGRARKGLFDEQRLGKSVQVVRAAAALNVERLLVLCPAGVRFNWAREWARWWGKSEANVLLELDAEIPPAGPVVASYDFAAANAARLRAIRWDLLVLDESHRLASTDSDRSNAVLGAEGIIHSSRRTWALSGTPWKNHPGDLWPLLRACGVTELSYRAFVDRYCVGRLTTFGFQIRGARRENAQELHELVYGTRAGEGFALRRRRAEVSPELPPVTFEQLIVEPEPYDLSTTVSFGRKWALPGREKLAQLEQHLANQRADLEARLRACGGLPDAELATLKACAESVSTLRRFDSLQKVGSIAALVSAELDIDLYGKIVLGTWFRDTTEGLRQRLAKYGAVTIYGGTSAKERDGRIARFQTRGDCRVAIVQLDTGSEGVSFNAAWDGILVDQSWVPSHNAQWGARMLGPDQRNRVNIRVASLPNSLDQYVDRRVRQKTQEIAELNGDWRAAGPPEFEAIEDDPPVGFGAVYA